MVDFSPEFFDTYAEAHRQRPATFHYPAAIHQIAIWHPRRFNDRFAPYLADVFQAFVHLRPQWPRSDDLGKSVTGPLTHAEILGLSRRLKGMFAFTSEGHESERLVFDFADPGHDRLAWRLEVHREFIAISVQVGLELRREGDDLVVSGFIPATGAGTPAFQQRVRPSDHVTDCLFDRDEDKGGLEHRVRSLMAPIHERIDRWTAHWAKEPGTQPLIFASFYGCVAPWTIFAAPGLERPAPSYPGVDTNGFSQGPETAAGLGRTARFLDAIWEDLSGDFLNGHRSGVEQKGQSVVACHLQHGHALYISSLGSRRDRMDRSPLHYLLLYDDVPAAEEARPSGALTSDARLKTSWRLSRLVGRLHDVGLTRLAVLRRAKEMRNFAQYLSHVESELQRYDERAIQRPGRRAPLGGPQIDNLREMLFDRTEQFEESIVNRSKQSAFYFETLKVSVEDLGIVPIPRYQSYDRFLRRRLYGTLSEVGDLAHRYQSVLRMLNTIYQIRSTKKIEDLTRAIQDEASETTKLQKQLAKLQDGAGLIALVLLLYYVADSALKASSPDFVTEYGGLVWYVVAILLLAVFAVHFLMWTWGRVRAFCGWLRGVGRKHARARRRP